MQSRLVRGCGLVWMLWMLVPGVWVRAENGPTSRPVVPKSAKVKNAKGVESSPSGKPSTAGNVGKSVVSEEEKKLAEELAKELGASKEKTSSQAGQGGGGLAPGMTLSPTTTSSRVGGVTLLPNISAILTVGMWWFSDKPTFRLAAHEPAKDSRGFRFQLQELELAFQANIDPYIRADIFLALGTSGIEIEEAYLTTLQLPLNMQIKVGSFYTRFGRFNTQHFLETQPFVDMPLVNRRFFGGEQLRGLGGEVSFLLPTPWYFLIAVNITSAQNEVSLGLPVGDMEDPWDLLTVVHVQQFFPLGDEWSITWGLSFAQGPNNTGGPQATESNRTYFAGTDLYIRWRSLRSLRYVALQAEYITRIGQVPEATVIEGGMYVHLDFRINRNWQISGRFDYFGLPSLLQGELKFAGELRKYYEPSQQWRAGLAVSFYASEFHRIRAQYNIDHLLGGAAVAARDPIHEVMLQYQFVMGSHGAHPF